MSTEIPEVRGQRSEVSTQAGVCTCTGCRLVNILLGLVDNSRMSVPERSACFDALYLLEAELKHEAQIPTSTTPPTEHTEGKPA